MNSRGEGVLRHVTVMRSQPLLLPYGGKDKQLFGDAVQQLAEVDSGDRNFAIGLVLDRISQQGIDFKKQACAFRIQSSAGGKSPMSAYTYYLSLSKNTLQFSVFAARCYGSKLNQKYYQFLFHIYYNI